MSAGRGSYAPGGAILFRQVAIVGALTSAALLARGLLVTFQAPVAVIEHRVENLDAGEVADPARVITNTFRPCTFGLCVVPGEPGSLTVTIDPPAGAKAAIRLWLYERGPSGQDAPIENAVEVSADGGATFTRIEDRIHSVGALLDL